MNVYVGVAQSACEDLSATLLVINGLPSGLTQLESFAAQPSVSDASIISRQAVTLSCSSALSAQCSSWECLSWQSVPLSSTVAANQVLSFAFVNLHASSGARVRVGVVPFIYGSSGISSLLVSPIFQVCVCVHMHFVFVSFL